MIDSSWRWTVQCTALTMLVALMLLPGCRRTAVRDPDVILLVVDTLRAQSLSLYGYDRPTSPHLQVFARDAVTYEKAITPSTWSVPAHASLLTGRWPSFNGAERVPGDRILALPINPEVPTLAEELAEHGWRTAGFAANSTYLSSLFGFHRGFQTYVADYGFVRADEVASDIVEWLAKTPEKSFVFANILDPHEPFEPPPPFDARFPGRNQELGTSLGALMREPKVALTPEVVAHFVSQYDGEIAYTDEALGRFFAKLREMGRYDSALIIVTSDHGELLGEHGLAGHGLTPLEPLVHVPLVVKYPGNRHGGTRESSRVSTMAVFATIFQTLGLPPPQGMQSVPLGRAQETFVEDLDSAGNRVRVAYDGEFKLVSTTTPQGARDVKVYDLSADPGELWPADVEVENLHAALAAFAALPRPSNTAQRPVIDAEQEAKLRALGYIR